MADAENVCPQAWGGAMGGVAREVRRLLARAPPGVKLLPPDDLACLTALLDGPADTPYSGGVFRVQLSVGGGYPASPPRATFLTRIFHPNVSSAGAVCVDTLARGWRPELGLAHALLAVRCLLIAPNADSALNAEAAALLRDRYQDYFARAKLYTEIHAQAPEAPTQEGGGGDACAEGPSAKRERRAASAAASSTTSGAASGAAPRSGRDKDKRRILKRL